MISGLIIYSKEDKDKNAWFINRCIERFAESDIKLIYQDVGSVLDYVTNNKVDFAIYRSRDYKIVEALEALGIKCFNNSLTNKIANDKYLTYQFLNEQNIPCLKSNLSIDKLECPFVMKSTDGHGGQEVYLINSKDEVEKYRKNSKKYVYQQFYKNDGDLRVYVLNKKVIGSVLRNSHSDFRSNFSLGGEITIYEPEQSVLDKAIKIANLLDSDYIGVDFLKVNNEWLVNEIEDPVGARMLFKAYGIDTATLLSDYILREITDKSKL